MFMRWARWAEFPARQTERDAWWRTAIMLLLAFAVGAIAIFRLRLYAVA
jgi:hypothetical protein